MRKSETAISIDKLKVCLKQPQQTFEQLKEHYTRFSTESKLRILDFDEFYLLFIEENDISMTAVAFIKEMETDTKLGTFVFNKNGGKYNGYAFFTFENRSLYTQEVMMNDGMRHNLLAYLPILLESLHLEFNSITKLEIAVDSSANLVHRTRTKIGNIREYDLIVNGKKVKDDEPINAYGEYFTRSRQHLSRTPTLYFHHAKATDIEMRIYNKRKEIEESSQEKAETYFKWLNWGNTDNIYRCEVVLRNSNIREFIKRICNDYAEYNDYLNILHYLCNTDFLVMLWADTTDRLAYFRDKQTKEKISMIDLV